jgi:hypothetical protein
MKSLLFLVLAFLIVIGLNKLVDTAVPPHITVIGNTILGDKVIIDETCHYSGPMVERIEYVMGKPIVTRYGCEQYKRIFKLNSDGIFCWD